MRLTSMVRTVKDKEKKITGGGRGTMDPVKVNGPTWEVLKKNGRLISDKNVKLRVDELDMSYVHESSRNTERKHVRFNHWNEKKKTVAPSIKWKDEKCQFDIKTEKAHKQKFKANGTDQFKDIKVAIIKLIRRLKESGFELDHTPIEEENQISQLGEVGDEHVDGQMRDDKKDTIKKGGENEDEDDTKGTGKKSTEQKEEMHREDKQQQVIPNSGQEVKSPVLEHGKGKVFAGGGTGTINPIEQTDSTWSVMKKNAPVSSRVDEATQGKVLPMETDYTWPVKKRGTFWPKYNKTRTLGITSNIVKVIKKTKIQMEMDLASCAPPVFDDKDCTAIVIKGKKSLQLKMEKANYQEIKAVVERIIQQGNASAASVDVMEYFPVATDKYSKTNLQEIHQLATTELTGYDRKIWTFNRLRDDTQYLEGPFEFHFDLKEDKDIISVQLFWEPTLNLEEQLQGRQYAIGYIQDKTVPADPVVEVVPDHEDKVMEDDKDVKEPDDNVTIFTDSAVESDGRVCTEPREPRDNVNGRLQEKCQKSSVKQHPSNEKSNGTSILNKLCRKLLKTFSTKTETSLAKRNNKTGSENADKKLEADQATGKTGLTKVVCSGEDERVLTIALTSARDRTDLTGDATSTIDGRELTEDEIPERDGRDLTEEVVPERDGTALTGDATPTRNERELTEDEIPVRYGNALTEDATQTKDGRELTEDAMPLEDRKAMTGNATPTRKRREFTEDAIPARDGNALTEDATPTRDGIELTEDEIPVRDGRDLTEEFSRVKEEITYKPARCQNTNRKKGKAVAKTVKYAIHFSKTLVCAVRDWCKKTIEKGSQKVFEILKKTTARGTKPDFEKTETKATRLEVEANVPTPVCVEKRPIEASKSSVHAASRNGVGSHVLNKTLLVFCFIIRPVSGASFTTEVGINDWILYLGVPTVIGIASMVMLLGEHRVRPLLEFLRQQLGRLYINGRNYPVWVQVEDDGIHLAARIVAIYPDDNGVHLAAGIIVVPPPTLPYILAVEEDQVPTGENQELVVT